MGLSLHLDAAYELLSDGEWHPYPDVFEKMYNQIPPGVAKRTALKHTEYSRTYRRPEIPRDIEYGEDDLITRGRSLIISSSLQGAIRGGRMELDRADTSEKRFWKIRALPRKARPPQHEINGAAKVFKEEGNSERSKQIRAKIKTSATITRRKRLSRFTDEELQRWPIVSTTKRAALAFRPWLWPIRNEHGEGAVCTFSIGNGWQYYRCGWLSYNEEEGTWTIRVVWPEEETLVFTDVYEFINSQTTDWRFQFPK